MRGSDASCSELLFSLLRSLNVASKSIEKTDWASFVEQKK